MRRHKCYAIIILQAVYYIQACGIFPEYVWFLFIYIIRQPAMPASADKQKMDRKSMANKTPQQTPTTPPKTSLSTDEMKNEYEWKKFKVIRKVKKVSVGVGNWVYEYFGTGGMDLIFDSK